MRKILCLIFLLSLEGCSVLSLKENSIESIVIEERKTGSRIKIIDQSQISQLLKVINSSRKEFGIFKGNYIITILYRNKEIKTILIEGDMLKIDGITYRMSKKNTLIIEKYFEDG